MLENRGKTTHTTLSMLQADLDVVVLDNLSSSSVESLFRLAKITSRAATFIQGDIRDSTLLGRFFSEDAVDAVLHFASLKVVGESFSQPHRYDDNNVHVSQVLLQLADAEPTKSELELGWITERGWPDTIRD